MSISSFRLTAATKDGHLALMSQLTTETANTKTLVQLNLISRILCLHDCEMNSSKCGQVNGKPMIVDFHIDKQSGGYVKSSIAKQLYKGNGEFNYYGLIA